MFILQGLRYLLVLLEIVVGAPILYLCIVSISAIVTNRKRQRDLAAAPSPARSRFAVLIPAHNEEIILNTLLESLAQLTYPRDHYDVYVVADNCTDSTPTIVRAAGWVHLYERFDTSKRGKGYALSWLWQKLEEDQLIYDAYVILDADSVVVPTFLHAMDRELVRGAQAMQGCNAVLNSSESPSTALRWLALTLINHVRPLGRNGLGGSSTLTGNGMCLSRALLQRHPWRAFAIAEDYQYYLSIIEQGERVRYVPDALVRSHMPTTFAQMRTQDVRWEASESERSTWSVVWSLLRTGLRKGSFTRIEAIAELLAPPLSFMLCSCLLTLVAALLIGPLAAQIVALVLVVGLLNYIGTAFYLMRPPRNVYRALLYAPGFVIWKLWVFFVLKRSKAHTGEWVRTSRSTSTK